MRKICLIITMLFLAVNVYAADTKLSALTELAVTPDDTDTLYILDSTVSKKITVANLMGAVPFDAPGVIGGTTPAAGSFTSVSVSASPTPGLLLRDSDNAAGTASINGNSSGGANDIILSIGVEDSTGESTTYAQANGVTETFDFLKPIKGRMVIGPDITASTSHDTNELHNTFYPFTAAATVTLDAAADAGFGSTVTYWVRDAAEAAVIDPQVGEKINLAGVAGAAGVAITATGVGSSITLIAVTDTDGSGTDGYICLGNNGFASE